MWTPEHRPDGVVCSKCGVHASKHRRKRGTHPHDNDSNRVVDRIIGVDGEGVGRKPHRYIYLAAVDENGNGWGVSDKERLTTVDCLDFLVDLPRRSLVVGFSFVYDITMMLRDLPDRALYLLLHEKLRIKIVDGKALYRPIKWNGYRINYMNRRLTVGRVGEKYSTTVWDIFAFFQSSFVKAITAWKTAPQNVIDEIERMKANRSEFETTNREEIHAYCQKECYYLAKLGRQLINAHDDAGLSLKSYYGAGSTASVFLRRVGIQEKRGETPEAMRLPIACAFFGGRFENSIVGEAIGPTFNYDISSAYPYQTFSLPCLSCGHWYRIANTGSNSLNPRRGQLQLVHWSSREFAGKSRSWGPLPVRARNGSIVFPLSGLGGWCWGREFEQGQRLNPALTWTEAWLYETECEHQPFGEVPVYYRQRVALGKDSRGIVLKLGINSIYGKLAQSKGLNPPFQSWVWAGAITSNTRAQLLEAILCASDPGNVLMLATDGVGSRERLALSSPRDTGTWDLAKPLGGWEEKLQPQGMFFVRPGIYFPLNPTAAEIEQVRGRGLGRKALYDHWQAIIDGFHRGDPKVTIGGMQRFVGAKSGILLSNQGVKRRDCFGEWIEHKVDVSFDPRPKRRAINPDGSLETWPYLDFESVPYDPATLSPDAILLKIAEQIAEEQPDADISELQ